MTQRADGLTALPNGRIATVHNPGGLKESELFFEEEKVAGLVRQWQKSGVPELISEITLACLPLVESIIKGGGFSGEIYLTGQDFRQECARRTPHIAGSYDPERGRAFAYFSRAYKNHLLKLLLREKCRTKHLSFSPAGKLDKRLAPEPVEQSFSPAFLEKLYAIPNRFPEYAPVLRFVLDRYLACEGRDLTVSRTIGEIRFRWPDLSRDKAKTLLDYTLIQVRRAFLGAEDYAVRASTLPGVEAMPGKKRFRIWQEMAELLGPELFSQLVFVFGGCEIHFPGPELLREILTQEEEKYFSNGTKGWHETVPLDRCPKAL